jgi:hypothetical protein
MRTAAPLVLLLAACSPAAEQTANQASANAAEPAAAEQEREAVPSMEGEWRIERINGAPPDQIWPMNVSIGDGRFTIQSECRRMAWSFRQDGNVVQLSDDPGASADCPRVRSPAELMVERPVGLANIAMFSDEGRKVQLTGPGGSVDMVRR